MDLGEPKFRRRKADRPAEIVSAALQVFAEKGFAAAKLDDIARHAGLSKGALYLYFETKEDLFRAVVIQALSPNVAVVKAMAEAHPGPLAELLRGLVGHVAGVIETTPLGGVLKMVVGESGNFPEIARVWYEQVVSQLIGVVTEAMAAAQARGEVKAGDPRIYALQLISPLMVSVLWRETFVPVGAPPFDIPTVMSQHVDTLLAGMLTDEARR